MPESAAAELAAHFGTARALQLGFEGFHKGEMGFRGFFKGFMELRGFGRGFIRAFVTYRA